MSSLAIGGIVFSCVFGGVLLGMVLRRALPHAHLGSDSKDTVKLGMGLVGTLAALVLGLLLASAKGSYDTERAGIAQMAAKAVWLDRMLAHYGPETGAVRKQMQASMAKMIDSIWPPDGQRPGQTDPFASKGDAVYDLLQQLVPASDAQRDLKTQAMTAARELGQMRWLLFTQTSGAVAMPVLTVVVFWLTIIFISFGLFAPFNLTVVGAMAVCAFSVSGAIFLILELDQPFEGMIKISGEPMRAALAHLGAS